MTQNQEKYVYRVYSWKKLTSDWKYLGKSGLHVGDSPAVRCGTVAENRLTVGSAVGRIVGRGSLTPAYCWPYQCKS
jgi:hypothetical protein